MERQKSDKHIANNFLEYLKFIDTLCIEMLIDYPNARRNVFHSFKEISHEFLQLIVCQCKVPTQ